MGEEQAGLGQKGTPGQSSAALCRRGQGVLLRRSDTLKMAVLLQS